MKGALNSSPSGKTTCKKASLFRVKIKQLREYHNFYFQNNTLLLAGVFENFRNTCLKIYELDPAKFLSAPGFLWQATLKKTKVKTDLLTLI